MRARATTATTTTTLRDLRAPSHSYPIHTHTTQHNGYTQQRPILLFAFQFAFSRRNGICGRRPTRTGAFTIRRRGPRTGQHAWSDLARALRVQTAADTPRSFQSRNRRTDGGRAAWRRSKTADDSWLISYFLSLSIVHTHQHMHRIKLAAQQNNTVQPTVAAVHKRQ